MLDHHLTHFMFEFAVTIVVLAYGMKMAGITLLELYERFANFREAQRARAKVREDVEVTWTAQKDKE